MSVHQLKAGAPIEEMTPAQFFDDVVPQILKAQKEPCASLGGTYGIQLFGDNGGAWTLDFAQGSLASGTSDDTDLYVEMKAADFAAMMKGTLDVEKAALDGKIQFEGDPSLFANLAAILQPAT